MEKGTEKVRQYLKMETDLMDGGCTIKSKERVFMFLSTATYTMGKLKWAEDTEKEFIYTKMAMSISGNGKMI